MSIETWVWRTMTRCSDKNCGWVEQQMSCAHHMALLGNLVDARRRICPQCGERTERAVGRPHMRKGKYGVWPIRVDTYEVDHIEWKDRPRAELVEVTQIPNRRSIGQTVRGLLR